MTGSPTHPTAPPVTGRRETQAGRHSLVLERAYRAPIDDVWAACTDPARMQRWIGTWSGDPQSGSVVFRMTAEGEDVTPEVYDVEECTPPRRFALRSRQSLPFTEDAAGPAVHWVLRLDLTEAEGVTTLVFAQDLAEGALGVDMVASVGPGWEYYLARLTAHLADGDVDGVRWEDYEAQSAGYRERFGRP